MVENSGYIKKGECISCGAPLKRAKQRGKYICEHCGAVFFDDRLSLDSWEEDLEDNTLRETEPGPPPITSTYTDTSGRTVAIIAAAVMVTICLIILVVNSLSRTSRTSRSDTKSSERNPSLEKPQMLSTLPRAVKAGTIVAYQNWEILVEPEFSVSNNQLYFKLSVRNWNDDTQIFRYEPKTIIVYDNFQKSYPQSLGSCAPDLPNLTRQITFETYETIVFQSNNSWCNRNSNFPPYLGVISQSVTNLYLHLEAFGVFKNITFVFDL